MFSPNNSIIALDIVDPTGHKGEWDVFLGNATFTFGVVPEATPFPEFTGGRWVSYLLARYPDGSELLFGERFIEEK